MLRLLLFFRFLLLFMKSEEQLERIIRNLGIQPIVDAPTRAHDKRLGRLAVFQQILLNLCTYLLQIGSCKEGAIHIIDVLGNSLHANALLTSHGQDMKYLLVVGHSDTKRGRYAS